MNDWNLYIEKVRYQISIVDQLSLDSMSINLFVRYQKQGSNFIWKSKIHFVPSTVDKLY